jgi:hypothetical protein
MGLVTVALIIVVVWIGLLVFVLAISKASGRADANEERNLAAGLNHTSDHSPAPDSDATVQGVPRPTEWALSSAGAHQQHQQHHPLTTSGTSRDVPPANPGKVPTRGPCA